MQEQVLSPGLQDRDHTDLGSEVIGREGGDSCFDFSPTCRNNSGRTSPSIVFVCFPREPINRRRRYWFVGSPVADSILARCSADCM